ncbi:MAG TPA: C1 family peptidase [Gemmatimonadaceae bacterium]|nr:C1 family peptidase [Gemmatimonadaceae bacterium]
MAKQTAKSPSSTLVPRSISRYGWRPDTPDQRDRPTLLKVSRVNGLPATVDLSKDPAMPKVYDQGELGSCTANAIAAAYEYETCKQSLTDFTPSRLAIYYGERYIEHTVASDAGAEIRDGMKVVAKTGVAPEKLWPYVESRFTKKPPAAYFNAAKSHICTEYQAVEPTEASIKSQLAAGFPVVFGISVYDSFESDAVANSGVVPMPKAKEKMIGGHAILITGYTSTAFRFRNSWGTNWGKGGYATLPNAYVLDPKLAGDFWTIRVVK